MLVAVLAVVVEALRLLLDLLDTLLVDVRLFSAQALAQDLLKGEAEILAEECVDARVDGRVAVAQPEENREQDGRDALRTECAHHIHREEGHPATNESAHDDAQRLGRLGLHFEALHLSLDAFSKPIRN